MVHWMDHVDSTLRTILHEVNTLEEFEKEKTIFQVSIGQFQFGHIQLLYHIIEIFKYFSSWYNRNSITGILGDGLGVEREMRGLPCPEVGERFEGVYPPPRGIPTIF